MALARRRRPRDSHELPGHGPRARLPRGRLCGGASHGCGAGRARRSSARGAHRSPPPPLSPSSPGYRWYDAQGTKPQWAFGHGLSYSTFSYAPLVVAGAVSPTASVTIFTTICNVAGPAGAEVAQLYVSYPAAANEPPKLLKGFEKVAVAPGACEAVGFTLAAADLWTWNVVTQAWQLVPGTYGALVGSSSADVRQTASFQVTAA